MKALLVRSAVNTNCVYIRIALTSKVVLYNTTFVIVNYDYYL